MSATLVWPVATAQLLRLGRDRRLAGLAMVLVLAMVTSLVTGEARKRRQADNREVATAQAAGIWNNQGPTNPHGAAHFGRDVYAPISPLAALDPGLTEQLGVSVRLEGHSQNPARERPVEGGAAISRFSGFSAAWALQIAAPLMIILAGFSIFAGDRSRQILTQELAAGVRPTTLMTGQLVALGAIALGVAAVFTSIGLIVVMAGGGGLQGGGATLAVGVAYFVYLMVFVGLTLAASAGFRSARGALVALLCFWAASTLVAPKLAPAIAEQLHPTPTAPAFEDAVMEDAENGVSGHDPADERLERFKVETLRRYGVTRVEDLPVNFAGLALKFGERNATDTYNRHYARLHKAYDGQAAVQRRLALLSPQLAVGPLSMALAGTDGDAHLAFLKQAETYRYSLIQTLNEAVVRHKPDGDTPYLADVGALTDHLVFDPRAPSLNETLGRQAGNVWLLLAWAAAALALALLAARRLGRQP